MQFYSIPRFQSLIALSLLAASLVSYSACAGEQGVSAASQTEEITPIGDEITLQSRPVRVVNFSEIQNDPAHFYENFGYEPVIIKGVYSNLEILKGLNSTQLKNFLSGYQLEAYEKATGRRVTVSAEEYLENIQRGTSQHNVVDHPIKKSPFVGQVDVPHFLSDNWLGGSGMGTDRYVLSLTSSAKGNFTPLHVDSFGMQAWMYLAYGKKHWILFPPNQVPAIFDSEFKRFYNPRRDSASSFPLARFAQKYAGTIEGGDLMFFPPGWAHQVITEEESFGVGGSIVNEFQMVETVRTWNIDRSFSDPGALDLKKLIESLAHSRTTTEQGKDRVSAAIQRLQRWEQANAQ